MPDLSLDELEIRWNNVTVNRPLRFTRFLELKAAFADEHAPHRAWLREALAAFFAGRPIPPARAALTAALAGKEG